MSLHYDAKSDLWSVATIVYQCLTGRAPFIASTPQQLRQLYERSAQLQPRYHLIIKNGSPYSITDRRVPELIPVLGSQPAGDVSHKPGSRLPLLSAGPATSFAAW